MDPRSVEPLIRLLKDEIWYPRMKAVQALGKIGDPSAAGPLAPLLNDEDRRTQVYAAVALGATNNPIAVETLIGALKHENPKVRSAAAEALGKMNDARAVEPLIPALQDEDPSVQNQAVGALWKITGEYLVRDPAEWQRWLEQNKEALSDRIAAEQARFRETPPRPTRTIATSVGKSIVVYDHQRLVIYDSRAKRSEKVAEIQCESSWVCSSAQGKYIALVTGPLEQKRHVAVYDIEGKRKGRFDLDKWWTVRAVSDAGPLLVLWDARSGPYWGWVRLVDATGKVLYDAASEKEALLGFTTNGTPYVCGESPDGDQFVRLLDQAGMVQWERTLDRGMWICNIDVGSDARRIVLDVAPVGMPLAERQMVHDVASDADR